MRDQESLSERRADKIYYESPHSEAREPRQNGACSGAVSGVGTGKFGDLLDAYTALTDELSKPDSEPYDEERVAILRSEAKRISAACHGKIVEPVSESLALRLLAMR